MDLESARHAIFGHYMTGMTVDTVYENKDDIDPSDRTAPYVKLFIRLNGTAQESLGTPALIRQRGALQADVYVKKGQGTKPSYALVKQISDLFIRQNIGGVEFAIPTPLSPLEVDGWARLTIRCPFHFDSQI